MDIFTIPIAQAHHEGTVAAPGSPTPPPPSSQGGTDATAVIAIIGGVLLVACIGWSFWSVRKK